ncbi:MAG: TlyA family RNA methyltransferase [Clostridia bacterium]
MAEKKRLDVLLFEKKLAPSTEKAKLLIMQGIVYVDNQKSDKPGTSIDVNANIEVRCSTLAYVSRGGLKLEKAINEFKIDLNNKICMDVGASTGGFTDCMLQNHAKKVYSIDVGYGQLAWKLRTDERVVNLERTNARYLTTEQVSDLIDFTSVDVAFISLKKILPAIYHLLNENARLVCLIKPQFEASRDKVGKKGVVRDKAVHLEVVDELCNFFLENGFSILNLSFSPIKGPEGNIEYLAYLEKSEKTQTFENFDVYEIVNQSHSSLIN